MTASGMRSVSWLRRILLFSLSMEMKPQQFELTVLFKLKLARSTFLEVRLPFFFNWLTNTLLKMEFQKSLIMKYLYSVDSVDLRKKANCNLIELKGASNVLFLHDKVLIWCHHILLVQFKYSKYKAWDFESIHSHNTILKNHVLGLYISHLLLCN